MQGNILVTGMGISKLWDKELELRKLLSEQPWKFYFPILQIALLSSFRGVRTGVNT